MSQFEEALAIAIQAARLSPCAKDQRGAAIYHPKESRIVGACNGPPRPFICDGSQACRDHCGKVAVHAEERALHVWYQGGTRPRGVSVVHIRTVEGQPVPSGGPSCATCSRTLLVAQAVEVWLLHEDGWRSYPTEEFHALSLAHERNRLPVIRPQGQPIP